MPIAVIILVVLATTALVLIVVAPWRRVREESTLSPEVQARLLLGEAPSKVAADLDATPPAPPGLASAAITPDARGDEEPAPPRVG